MTWTKEKSAGFESRKCRDRNLQYLQHGSIFDLGCGDEKVVANAVGIDISGKSADLRLDLTNPQSLKVFNDEVVDTVFSSHCLEHITDTENTLKEWWRLVKPNGYLILYLPHRDLYPDGENPDHKHNFIPDDIITILNRFASYKLLVCDTHDEDSEYSFEIVAQKIAMPDKGQFIIKDTGEDKPIKQQKRALAIRYGALGDLFCITPLLRALKEDGYYVVLNCTPDSMAVLENNPNIDDFLLQRRHIIPNTQLGNYHKEISKGFDKVINLCESIERTLLLEKRDEKYHLSKEERHKLCNVNYYDRTMELGGYPDKKGMRGEIYLSDSERAFIKIWKEKHKGFFKIMWQVKGSSDHKIYPYLVDIAEYLTENNPCFRIFLTGGRETQVIDWQHPNIRNCIGLWDIRESIIMTSAMDLVISPETGILNAAGCFDTPKIGLLTHSSKENLTKYFNNDYSIESNAECAPCHRLVHNTSECKVGGEYGLPVCMEQGLSPDKVRLQIIEIYEKWKNK